MASASLASGIPNVKLRPEWSTMPSPWRNARTGRPSTSAVSPTRYRLTRKSTPLARTVAMSRALSPSGADGADALAVAGLLQRHDDEVDDVADGEDDQLLEV